MPKIRSDEKVWRHAPGHAGPTYPPESAALDNDSVSDRISYRNGLDDEAMQVRCVSFQEFVLKRLSIDLLCASHFVLSRGVSVFSARYSLPLPEIHVLGV